MLSSFRNIIILIKLSCGTPKTSLEAAGVLSPFQTLFLISFVATVFIWLLKAVLLWSPSSSTVMQNFSGNSWEIADVSADGPCNNSNVSWYRQEK